MLLNGLDESRTDKFGTLFEPVTVIKTKVDTFGWSIGES